MSGIVATTSAQALSGSSFQPGYIISDQLFYDPGTMSAGQIQQFLAGQYNGCNAGFTCIRDLTVSTTNEAAEAGLCNGYAGAAAESAAQIIAKVSVSCGINPQVLIVLLQKESGVITSASPNYQAATGFDCPDSTGCNASYAGFFNQVYLAARQFKRYRLNPNNYGYVAGRSNFILYSPTTSCGGSQVFIANQATAGLYDYTPYQPDAAALNNLGGTGDACSTYGNRNFWADFNNWFGPPGYVTPVVGSSVSCLGASLGVSSGASLLSGSVPVGPVSAGRMVDALAVDVNGGLWYYRNSGAVSAPFVGRSAAATTGLPAYLAMAAGDVNGDGRADVVASGPDGTLWFYLGNGTSDPYSSGPVQIGSSGWAAFNWLGLADVNGDGRDDLLATTPDGRLFYYPNNGTSTPFQASTVLSSGWQNDTSISVGDLNGDGLADLIATGSDGSLTEYLNTGSPSAPFPATGTVIGASGWQNFNRVELGDINGDGLADLVATTPDGRLWYYQNNATTTPFTTGTVISAGGWQNYPTLLLANVHGTGTADLVTTSPDGRLWYYQNNGTTTPYVGESNVGSNGWQNFPHLTIGDVNGDGLPDLVATDTVGRLWYYPNTNTCQPFNRPFIIGTSGWNNFTTITLADVNGDGLADLIATDTAGRLWYYPNNGTGTPYTTPTILSSGWNTFTTITLGDVNGDGKADLIATTPTGQLWYYQNNGTANPYTTPTIIGTTGWNNFNHITLTDVNADGKADLIATTPDGRLWYYQNNGTTTPYTTGTVISPTGWQNYNRIL